MNVAVVKCTSELAKGVPTPSCRPQPYVFREIPAGMIPTRTPEKGLGRSGGVQHRSIAVADLAVLGPHRQELMFGRTALLPTVPSRYLCLKVAGATVGVEGVRMSFTLIGW